MTFFNFPKIKNQGFYCLGFHSVNKRIKPLLFKLNNKMSCYIIPFANFQQQKKNNILQEMKEEIALTPPQKNQQDSKDIRSLLQKQFEQMFLRHPSLSLDQAFYLEATKMHMEVLQKLSQVDKARREIDILNKQLGIQTSENKRGQSSHPIQQSDSYNEDRRKRIRRTAVEIARHYYCNIDKCNKSYGSQGSLNQHMKLKHKSHYTKQLLMLDLNRQPSPNSGN